VHDRPRQREEPPAVKQSSGLRPDRVSGCEACCGLAKEETMKTKLCLLLFGCLVLALSPLASSAATSSFITEGISHGVNFAFGGVGKDERIAMDAMAKNYNIKLVFAEAPRDYIAGVKVRIEDANGKLLLETSSNGPWFFAKLPQGDYRVIASFRNHREIRNLKVGSGLENVEFFWKA
jgi:hypothetical protein